MKPDPTTALLKLHEAEKQRMKHANTRHHTRHLFICSLEWAIQLSSECDRFDEQASLMTSRHQILHNGRWVDAATLPNFDAKAKYRWRVKK